MLFSDESPHPDERSARTANEPTVDFEMFCLDERNIRRKVPKKGDKQLYSYQLRMESVRTKCERPSSISEIESGKIHCSSIPIQETTDLMGSDDINQADSWHMKKKYTKSAKPEPEHRKRAKF